MFTKQTINNKIEGELPGFDDTVTFQIPRKGDLINTIFIRMVLRKSPTTFIVPIQSFGYEVFEYMELLIGDKIIDRMTGLEMRLLMKTSSTKNNVNALGVMCGEFVHDVDDPFATLVNYSLLTPTDQHDIEYRYFYVPIPFYFFRNPSLAVPLCAITKQEVSIRFKLKPYQACISQSLVNGYNTYPYTSVSTPVPFNGYADPLFSIMDFSVPVEYLYVSDDECKYFQKTPLNYTITQTQRTTIDQINAYDTIRKQQLNFINPIKELIMYPTLRRCLDLNETDPLYKNRYILFNKLRSTDGLFNNLGKYKGIVKSFELIFDDKTYVNSSIGNLKFLKNFQNVISRGRFTYDQSQTCTREDILGISFALEPSNYMDTGYINFNAFKSVRLETEFSAVTEDYTLFVIARSLNILVIKDGMCDIVFKNSIM
jgi:hypothetical protein